MDVNSFTSFALVRAAVAERVAVVRARLFVVAARAVAVALLHRVCLRLPTLEQLKT
jgi:hypothetical protein